MRNRDILLNTSFLVYLLTSISGVFLMIYHRAGADIIMTIGILFYLIFVISSISEVLKNQTVSKSEKNMWINGIILIAPIVGLIYILSGRKRILRNRK